MLRKLLAGAAALSVVATPALARVEAANPAAKLSVAKSVPASARSGPEMRNGRKALGGGLLIGIAVAAAVVVGIVLISNGDDDADSP